MSTGGAVAPTVSHDTSWRHFVRHFLEMVVAMIVGMAVLGAMFRLVLLPLLGFSYAEVAELTELRALVMATNMVIGMSLWMRHRGHGWASVWDGRRDVPFLYRPIRTVLGGLAVRQGGGEPWARPDAAVHGCCHALPSRRVRAGPSASACIDPAMSVGEQGSLTVTSRRCPLGSGTATVTVRRADSGSQRHLDAYRLCWLSTPTVDRYLAARAAW